MSGRFSRLEEGGEIGCGEKALVPLMPLYDAGCALQRLTLYISPLGAVAGMAALPRFLLEGA